ncbi:MAG TPA: hypothetical protein VKG78_09515 [Opitutaceae bacterium]|nr:hypothetical protein [Opitutaceae bacterium]
MNTNAPFPAPFRPELSLKRREPGSTQPPMGTPPPMPFGSGVPFGSGAPFEGDSSNPYGYAALQAAWDKLYRARALLEAEQAHLRDDRIALQGELDALEVRRQTIAARETRIQHLEATAAIDQEEAEDERDAPSAMSKLTRAPFEMARHVFGPKK